MPGAALLFGFALATVPTTTAAQDTDEGERILARLEYERLRTYSGRGVVVSARMRIARERVMALRGIAGQGVSSVPWRPLGPTRIDDPWRGRVAGRVSTIAIHPRDPAIVYIGAAQGGVWKTENRGASWTPLSDYECSLAMGSIAIDPVDPNIIYAGTGEQHFSGDSYYGCGVLRSLDGGSTWAWDRQLASAFLHARRGGARISRVIVDPVTAGSPTSTTVLAATDLGLFRSTDSGRTWRGVLEGIVNDLVLNRADPSILHAALMRDGVYTSTNGGLTWARSSNGMRDTDLGRINLAIAPSEPDVLYAAIHDRGEEAGPSGGLLVYRTDDGGATWRELEATGSSCALVCWYALTLAVHPLNPERLHLGAGQRLFISEDGGETFERVHPSNVYVDQHHLVFDTLSGPDVLYLANDGGVYRSMDAGSSWTSLATNLAIAQFYPGITPHPVLPAETLGGTQDQGTLRAASPTTPWTKVLAGDGGFTAIDAEDPDVWYGEHQWPFGPRRNGRRATSGIDLDERAAFIPPLVMDPVDSRRLYFGTQSLYRTENSANNWVRIYNSPRRATVRSIAPSPSDGNTVYASLVRVRPLDFSAVAFTHDGGLTWEESDVGLREPRYIGDLAVHPDDSDQAYAVVGGFGTGHVFQTTDGGRTWRDRTGNLPDHPVNAVLYDPDDPGGIYIGTDLGVFHSARGGDTWDMLADGMPMAAVFDLAARPGTGRLVAATHGRGMFEIPIAVPLTARVRPEAVADTILVGSDPQRNGRVIVAPNGQSDHMAGWNAAVSGTAPWITLTRETGQGRGRFSYAIAGADLAPGDHEAALEVTVAGVAGALTIPVSVHVAAPKGHMTLARTATEKSVLVYDTEPFEDSVAVSFEGPGAATVEWRATQPGNSRWFQLKSDSGVGDGFVTWTVDPDSTDVGTYTDSVVVAASLATGGPAAFVYTLSVEPPLSVTELRPISSYGVSGWSFVSTDSVAAELSGFGADSAVWTASSDRSPWLAIEQGTGGRQEPIVWTRSSESLDIGVYEDTITIRVEGHPDVVGLIVDRFEVVAPMSVEAAAQHLLGLERLVPAQESFLDWFGNGDEVLNAGDVLRWLDHCGVEGEGSGCEETPAGAPPAPDSTPRSAARPEIRPERNSQP